MQKVKRGFVLTHSALDHIKMWSDAIILLGFLKILNYVPKDRENFSAKKLALVCQLNVAMAHRNYFRQNNL